MDICIINHLHNKTNSDAFFFLHSVTTDLNSVYTACENQSFVMAPICHPYFKSHFMAPCSVLLMSAGWIIDYRHSTWNELFSMEALNKKQNVIYYGNLQIVLYWLCLNASLSGFWFTSNRKTKRQSQKSCTPKALRSLSALIFLR